MDLSLFEDKNAEEFDVQVYGGPESGQPLTIIRRRFRKREMVVIDWKVEDWEEWENPIVFGRRYTNALPLRIADNDKEDDARNPFKPIIPGSAQRTGTTAELELPTGHTAHFAFWLKGVNWPRPKGILPSKPKPWSTRKRPITFSVLMHRPDSLGRLREMKQEEDLKNQILHTLRQRENEFAPQAEESKSDPDLERLTRLLDKQDKAELYMQYGIELDAREALALGKVDDQLSRNLISPEQAHNQKYRIKTYYNNCRDELISLMTKVPKA